MTATAPATTAAPTSPVTSQPASSVPATSNPATSGPATTSVASPPTTSAPSPEGTQTIYGQCGGVGWTGPTACALGSTCIKQNDCEWKAHDILSDALINDPSLFPMCSFIAQTSVGSLSYSIATLCNEYRFPWFIHWLLTSKKRLRSETLIPRQLVKLS